METKTAAVTAADAPEAPQEEIKILRESNHELLAALEEIIHNKVMRNDKAAREVAECIAEMTLEKLDRIANSERGAK